MKWIKLTLSTTSEAVDLISSMLADLGIEGIEIEDRIQITEEERKHLFIDFLPELGDDDGSAKINFYLDPAEDMAVVLQNVKAGLKELSEFINIGSGDITVSETEDKDWINNWKQFFKPFRIDDTIVIKPTWEELKDAKANDIVIEIDPGISFGTGSHETTKMCILFLKQYMKPGYTVLDAGSGSGILSITAGKLGAAEAIGIDIDPIATDAGISNAEINGFKAKAYKDVSEISFGSKEHKLAFITGNIIEDTDFRTAIGKGRFDLVVANILADVIVPLTDVIGENLKPEGVFICSGIINTKEEEVKSALNKNGFKILDINRMGDWVAFAASRI